MVRPRATALALVATLIMASLGGCLPAAAPALAPPTMRLDVEGSGLIRLDLTDAQPSARVRLAFEVANPNRVALQMLGFEGRLWIADVRAASVHEVEPLTLPARASARLAFDVDLASESLGTLGPSLAEALAGRPLSYRLDGQFTSLALDSDERVDAAAELSGTIPSRLSPGPPRLALDRAASSVRSVSFDQVVMELGLVLANDGSVGLEVRATDLRLALGGRDVATVQVPTIALAPGASTSVVQTVVLNPVQLGAAIVTELTRIAAGERGSVEVSLRGPWELAVPGLWARTTAVEELLRARLE